jgi:hypothetical protein
VPLGHAEAEMDMIESSAIKPAIAIFFIIASMRCGMQYKAIGRRLIVLKSEPGAWPG